MRLRTTPPALALVFAALAVLATSTPASAHDVVIGSSPTAGETVVELPAAFSITTNEPMLAVGDNAGFALQVTDAAGAFYGDGCLTVVDATMAMGATLGEPGAYTLTWQIISSDGHPASGSFGFDWAPAPDAPISDGVAQPPACEPEATAEPTPGPTATATYTPAESSGSGHGADAGAVEPPLATVLWIGAGVLAAGIALAIVLFVTRRNRRAATEDSAGLDVEPDAEPDAG
jgi:methionine-rich copper-binding protein CopC